MLCYNYRKQVIEMGASTNEIANHRDDWQTGRQNRFSCTKFAAFDHNTNTETANITQRDTTNPTKKEISKGIYEEIRNQMSELTHQDIHEF